MLACPSDPVLSHSLPLYKTHDWRDSIPRSPLVLSPSLKNGQVVRVVRHDQRNNELFQVRSSVVLGVAMGHILSELAQRLCRFLHARTHLEGLLINISTGFVSMNSGNRYSGRSMNPWEERSGPWQQLPRHRSLPGVPHQRSYPISSAKPISLHTVATIPYARMVKVLATIIK